MQRAAIDRQMMERKAKAARQGWFAGHRASAPVGRFRKYAHGCSPRCWMCKQEKIRQRPRPQLSRQLARAQEV